MMNRTTVVVTIVAALLLWLWSVVRTSVHSPDEPLARLPAQGLMLADAGVTPSEAELASPLSVSEPEQALSRDVAALASQVDRAKRLAGQVGHTKQAAELSKDFASLTRAIENRKLPWRDSERLELHRRTRVLQHEVAKFTRDLEDVAVVRL